MSAPFIIYALCRSRTAWLANFLTYGDWECLHESAMFMRGLTDVSDLFTSGNIGCVETAAAQGRPLIRRYAPGIREVVILRPVEEVIESMLSVDIEGVGVYDRCKLEKSLKYADRLLRKIAAEPGVMAIEYSDLTKKQVCSDLFEFCLPYRFDEAWWESLKNKNIQVDVKAVIRYYHTHKEAIENFKRLCKRELFRLYRAGELLTEKSTHHAFS